MRKPNVVIIDVSIVNEDTPELLVSGSIRLDIALSAEKVDTKVKEAIKVRGLNFVGDRPLLFCILFAGVGVTF